MFSIDSDGNCTYIGSTRVRPEISGVGVGHSDDTIESVAHRSLVIQHRHPTGEEAQLVRGFRGALESPVGIGRVCFVSRENRERGFTSVLSRLQVLALN